jgi:hypothetical protein
MTEEVTAHPQPQSFNFSILSEDVDSIYVPITRPTSSTLRNSKVLVEEPSPITTKLQFSPESSLVSEFSKPSASNDCLIYEAELCRVKARPTQRCITRWCVLMSKELRIYRNKFALIAKEKPLTVVPTANIASIEFITPGKDCALYKVHLAMQKLDEPNSILSTCSNKSSQRRSVKSQTASRVSWSARMEEEQGDSLTFAVMHKFEFHYWQQAFKQLM